MQFAIHYMYDDEGNITDGFVQNLTDHLRPGGILSVWSSIEDGPFADALRSRFEEFRMVPVEFRNQLVDEDQKDWLFLAR